MNTTNISYSKLKFNLTIVDRIYHKLTKDILVDHKYELGQRIYIKEIEKDFNISQTPIRESLNRLVKDNIIIYKPRRGYYIIQLFFKDMKEIYKLREHFECIALEILCSKDRKRNYQIVNKLYNFCQKIDDSIINNDFNRQRDYNLQFHQSIVNATKNIRLIRFYNEIRAQLILLDTLTDKFHHGPSFSNQEHKEITHSLADFNSDLAVSKMRQHISSVMTNIQKQMQKYYVKDFDNIKVSELTQITNNN